MLTLVERQPRITPVSWDMVMRLSRRARALVATWRSGARQRQALARLDDRLLADIGLTREAQMVICPKRLSGMRCIGCRACFETRPGSDEALLSMRGCCSWH